MADTEILQGEIEALQEAVLETDQRVDEMEQADDTPSDGGGDLTQQCLGRIEATLEQMSSCLERMEARTAEQIQEVQETAEQAVGAAEVAAEASVLAAAEVLAEQDVISEDTSQAPEEAVEEVEAPPEETSRAPSMSWWERMLLAR